jgi:transposase
VKLQPLVLALKAQLLACTILHADETPVPMLKPGLGRTHRAYLWSYSSSEYEDLQAVIYDFADSRSGLHAREFLGDWSGKLVCDDFRLQGALRAWHHRNRLCRARASQVPRSVHQPEQRPRRGISALLWRAL